MFVLFLSCLPFNLPFLLSEDGQPSTEVSGCTMFILLVSSEEEEELVVSEQLLEENGGRKTDRR